MPRLHGNQRERTTSHPKDNPAQDRDRARRLAEFDQRSISKTFLAELATISSRQLFFAVGKPHRPMDAKLTGEKLAASPIFIQADAAERSSEKPNSYNQILSVDRDE